MPSFKKYSSAVALLQLLSVGRALAHPGGVPRLMGRNGYVDLADLPNRLVKRVVSPDGTCGGTKGYTCATNVNKCCSQYGWCGDTTNHCLASMNCQPAFGICTGGTTTTTVTPPTTTTTTATGGNPSGPPISTNGRCGTQGGSKACPSPQCCSESGYCGTGDSCWSPGCQVGFGKCDADVTPSGDSTSTVARTKVGNVVYGTDIYDCKTTGEIALTYDDGPDIYTDAMLNLLESYNAKATFFITGINNGKGAIDTTPAWNAVIKKMYAKGHQLASHTWSHADLSTLTEAKRRDEMYKLERAMANIVGFFPTYMRPPYSSCNTACRATMSTLGYHITSFDLDTDDYNNVTPALIQNAKDNFFDAVNPSNPATTSWLVIAHDIHEQTATTLTQYMLQTLQAKGYTAVTVGKCMNDPAANWYRGSPTVPGPSSSSSVAPSSSSSSIPPSSSSTSSTPTSSSSSSIPPSSSSTLTSTTTSSTTTVASPTGTACPANSPYHVKTWCAAPLLAFTNVGTCWTSVGNCYDQGDVCWSTTPYSTAIETGCGNYHGQVCAAEEAHCQSCANANPGNAAAACGPFTPTYPASIN